MPMNTHYLNLHDKYFNGYKADILSGSSCLINYCNEHTQFDEYIYILLWRPIEWMIDYAELEQFMQKEPNPTDQSISEFISNRNKLNVDQKVNLINPNEHPQDTPSWLKDCYIYINHLRRCRNAVIYHYIKDSNVDPFKYFNIIYKRFHEAYNFNDEYCEISPNNREIRLSEMSGIYDINIDQIYIRLRDIIEYMNDPEHDNVISICKMEELAQLLAYKILKGDLKKKITYIENNKRGIYVDGKKVDSYIDALTKKKPEREWLLLKKTTMCLKEIRGIRNMSLHILGVTDEMENDLRLVWATVMNNAFGYDERISRLLEPFIINESLQRSLRNLSSYNRYYKNESSSNALISIGNTLSLTIAASQAIAGIFYKYTEQLDKLSENDQKELYDKMSEEIIQTIDKCLIVDEKTKTKYKDLAKRYFGAKYENNKDTYHCLETALLLYETAGDLACDYAGICIELTRALEIYLYDKISCKLKQYLEQYADIKFSKDIKDKLAKDAITLGNYPYMYLNHTSKNSKRFLEFCKSQSIYSISDENTLKEEILYEMQKIGEMNKAYRKDSAHRGIISKEIMNDCMKDILMGKSTDCTAQDSKALLKRISEAMGDF